MLSNWIKLGCCQDVNSNTPMTQCNSNLVKYWSYLHFWHSALCLKKLLIILLKSYPNVSMRSSLFWDITQCILVGCYWRFMTNYRSYLQASSCPKPLKMQHMGWPGTVVTNYQSWHITSQKSKIHLHGGRSLRSLKCKYADLNTFLEFQWNGWAIDPAATTSISDTILWALFHVQMRKNFAF